MLFLADPNITPIVDLINTWIHIGQALVGSIGALAFIFALTCISKRRKLPQHAEGRRAGRTSRCICPNLIGPRRGWAWRGAPGRGLYASLHQARLRPEPGARLLR